MELIYCYYLVNFSLDLVYSPNTEIDYLFNYIQR